MRIGDAVTASITGGDGRSLTFEGTVHAISRDGKQVQLRIEGGIYVWVDTADVRPLK